MEPVSILSAAAAISAVAGKAWELGSFVRELCQGAKTVDGRVRRLESAVTELARACEHVQGQFESMSSSSSSETPALAWDEQGALTASIESQVKDCRRTLKDLRRLLVDLRPSGSSFFGRTSRHVRLQDRGQEINDFSMRIKTHTDTLQMSLQIVIIKIALATPDFLLRQLGTALEDLRVRLSRIENNSKPSASRFDGGEAHGVQILEHARQALRSGTTLYEASTAGSIAEVEPVTDSERSALIKEWASNVKVLREEPGDNSYLSGPDIVSAHLRAEENSGGKVSEDPSDASSLEDVAESLSEGQSVDDSDTNSAAPVEAAHIISLVCGDRRSSNQEPLASNASEKPNLIATDCGDHATVDSNEGTTSSTQFVPGCPSTEMRLLHLSSRNYTTTCTDGSINHKSSAKSTDLDGSVYQRKWPGQDTSSSAKLPLEDTDKAEDISSKYPMDSSHPLNQTARGHRLITQGVLITQGATEIIARLEALIHNRERIEPAVLSELAAADRAASKAQASERSGLALMWAVSYRDVYLIKPLVEEFGFSPNAKIKFDGAASGYLDSPLDIAIGLRYEPVIQELLDVGAKLTYTCNESPWFALLAHKYLRFVPPTSIESIKSVIDLLMRARYLSPVACVCEPRTTRLEGKCHDWALTLRGQARSLPADLSHYRMPLDAYILESLKESKSMTRYTVERLIRRMIHTDCAESLERIMKAVDEPTLKVCLRRESWKGLSPLFEAVVGAVAHPTRSLDVVRILLDKGASLDSSRLRMFHVGTGLFRRDFSQRQTVRQFALQSSRADLVALVKEHDENLQSYPTQAQTSI